MLEQPPTVPGWGCRLGRAVHSPGVRSTISTRHCGQPGRWCSSVFHCSTCAALGSRQGAAAWDCGACTRAVHSSPKPAAPSWYSCGRGLSLCPCQPTNINMLWLCTVLPKVADMATLGITWGDQDGGPSAFATPLGGRHIPHFEDHCTMVLFLKQTVCDIFGDRQ